jgi:hypothetical protein
LEVNLSIKFIYLCCTTLGLKEIHFTGVLPTELYRLGLLQASYMQERAFSVANVVVRAEAQVIGRECLSSVPPVIVIGGMGIVGRQIVSLLRTYP